MMDHGESILIVDDDEGARRTLEQILGRKGYAAESAGTGAAAVEKARERSFNLALVDIRLPDGEGVELIEPLRELRPGMDVILMTAYASLDSALKALNRGAAGYVMKPLDMDAVLGAIDRVLEKQRLVAAKREAEQALRESERRYRFLYERSPAMNLIIGADGTVKDANTAMLQVLGYSREETVGRPVLDFVPSETRQRVTVALQRSLSGRAAEGVEVDVCGKDGELHTILFCPGQVVTCEGEEPGGILVTGTDITERKRSEERLAYMATHDLLTGLPNRMLLTDRLVLEMARAGRSQKRLALLLLDLDQFKRVNDSLGHTVGDKLLQAVADRLKETLRKSDTVGRVGGDEFVILSPDLTEEEDEARVAVRVLNALRRPLFFDGRELLVTTSVGVAVYPDDGRDGDTLMRNADVALYAAKGKGRDRFQRYGPEIMA